MSAVNTSPPNNQLIDTSDRNFNLSAQGPAILGPIHNSGSNPNFGVHHHYPASVPAIEVKYRFYGVPAENRAFVDRPSILANMEAALSSPSSGCQILALKGLGGMGKTQLMLRYCYLHQAAYEYVFWLEVDNWSTAIESFRNLAINLGLDEESANGKDSENKLIDWVRSWLQRKKNWLLLLDNADGTMAQDVFKLLPRIGGNIILTTREPTPAGMAIVISVDNMQQEEALFLLYGVSSMDSINQDSRNLHNAREIVSELGFLPLAIGLARAYLDNTLTSFETYLRMFKNMNERAKLLGYKDNLGQYKHTVTTVWQLSLERIRAENPMAVQILQACTFFQPENIPVCLFENQYYILELILPFSGSPTTELSKKQSVREAVAMLVKFSFVTRTLQEAEIEVENPVNDLLTIHRLVQKVIYKTMDDDKRLRWAQNLATALNKDAQYDESAIYALRTQRIMDTYLSHIRHFVTMLDNLNQKPFISKDLSSLLARVIWYLLEHGRYSGIEELVQFSRLVSEATYGQEDERIVRSLINHAGFHQRLGKYVEAEPLYQRALTIEEKAKGSEHPNTATLLNNLANVYFHQGKYNEAEPLYRRALTIREKALGSEHPDAADSLNNLAILYFNRDKYDEAEPLFDEALVIREKALGPEHPDTADSLNNLAILYFNRGKYDKAELLFNRALVIRKKALGSEHPDTAMTMNNLATLYFNQGMYGEAEPLYQLALVIREQALGLEHPDTARSLDNLAMLYDNQGKYGEAEQLHKRALEIYEKIFGSEHSKTVKVRKILTQMGQAGLFKKRLLLKCFKCY